LLLVRKSVEPRGADATAELVHRSLRGVEAFAHLLGRDHRLRIGRRGGQQRLVVGLVAALVVVVRILRVDDTKAVLPVLALRDQHDAVG